MNAQEIHDRLRDRFPQWIVGGQLEAIDPWIEVSPAGLHEVCLHLRDDESLRFEMLHVVSAVDYCPPPAPAASAAKSAAEATPAAEGKAAPPAKAAPEAPPPHLEVVYHLSSLALRHRIVLKVTLPRWRDDVPGELPELASVSDIWSTANWHEREVYDLSGVRFTGHDDLRRILCPEDWPGHPLRRDFEMPAAYHGIPTR